MLLLLLLLVVLLLLRRGAREPVLAIAAAAADDDLFPLPPPVSLSRFAATQRGRTRCQTNIRDPPSPGGDGGGGLRTCTVLR